MLSMGPGLDLDRLKTAFTSLVTQAEPTVLPAFMLWVDLKVSEFKVNGSPPPSSMKLVKEDLHVKEKTWVTLEDLRKKCNKSESQNTGTRMSPANDRNESRANGYVDCSENQVKDFSMKKLNRDEHKRHNLTDESKTVNHSPKKSLKSIIDNIVKKETLADMPSPAATMPILAANMPYPAATLPSPLDLPHHMQLPVSVPMLPASLLGQGPFNLAKFLSQGLPLPPPHYADIADMKSMKHSLPMPEELSAKRFRADAPLPSDEAVCLKKDTSAVSPDGSHFSLPPVKQSASPMKDSICEKENHSQRPETPAKSRVNSALRELLTSKLSSQFSNREDTESPEPEKLVIDEDRVSDNPDFDCDIAHSPISEEEIGDKSRHPNECQVCGQIFQYRSSFRRHMKVHQGIFSHVCAVCRRKFTRKEHFTRHKCSRKPNKASRGAHTEITDGNSAVKVEFPPVQSSPEYRSEASMDGSLPEYPSSPIKVPFKVSQGAESRRKAAQPRKFVMVEESDKVEESFEEEPAAAEHQESVVTSEILPTSQEVEQPESPAKSHMDLQSMSPKSCEPDLYYSPRKESPQHCHPDDYEEALDLSCPQVSSSSPSPQAHTEEDQALNLTSAAPNTPTQQEFTIETGSYKVVTSNGTHTEGQERGNQFIKVVKQGNYLRLKEEAQVIAGQLCFVCPTCGKIFHRSSNFSRHMRIHRGVYSYVCPNCQRGFFRREHFQKHKCSRRGMSHTWDRKTKIDMVLAQNAGQDGSDAEGGSDVADSEESYPLCGYDATEECRDERAEDSEHLAISQEI